MQKYYSLLFISIDKNVQLQIWFEATSLSLMIKILHATASHIMKQLQQFEV
jgi:hypothetical protein